MSESSARISAVDANIEVQALNEVPLIDAGRRVIGMLDRVRYAILLEGANADGVANKIKSHMPIKRAQYYNVVVDDAEEEQTATRFLHFCNADGGVGQRISIYGTDLQQALAVCQNSFIPIIKEIRKAAGSQVDKDGIDAKALFGRAAGLRDETKVPLNVREPETFVKAVAELFKINAEITGIDAGSYATYAFDLPYLR